MVNSFYFQHDYNARNDQKILELRSEFGAEGYGIWWMLLETLAEQDEGIDRGAIGGLSLAYGVDKGKLKEIIDFCLEIGLLYDNSGYIRNGRMDEHKNWRETLAQAGKKGAENRWRKKGNNGGANGHPNGKERIEQDSTEQKKEKSSEASSLSLSEKMAKFKEKCFEVGKELKASNDTIEAFFNYWAEHNENGSKMKCEKQKTFNTKMRMQTWLKNERNRPNGKKKEASNDSEMIEYLYSNRKKENVDLGVQKYGVERVYNAVKKDNALIDKKGEILI